MHQDEIYPTYVDLKREWGFHPLPEIRLNRKAKTNEISQISLFKIPLLVIQREQVRALGSAHKFHWTMGHWMYHQTAKLNTITARADTHTKK